MNTLHFVKFAHKTTFDTIVFLVTVAKDTAEHMRWDADAKARTRIADWCREDYNTTECTAVCDTADTVDGFEPC